MFKQKAAKINFGNLRQVEHFMQEHVGVGVSFDVGFREIILLKQRVHIYYLNGLCDSAIIVELLKVLIAINDHEPEAVALPIIVKNRLVHQQFEETKDMESAVTQLLSGLIVIFIEDYNQAMVVDVRTYPGRSPEEPDTERVVRGSRDGYTENIIENTALTRRRVRDPRLRNEILQIGDRSKTDVCISYIKDIADEQLIKVIRRELETIKTDGLSMADKTIEEYIVHQGFNPFPLVRYTERPDVASNHLFEGHVLIMVDTSPSMIITPTTFFHHLQHAEEYRQSPAVGTFIRWIRFLGILISIFLLPLWYLLSLESQLLPEALSFIGPSEEGTIPLFLQIVFADIGIEFLRMAAIHTPTPLSTAMGLIAAILIGDIAIEVGLFSSEVILYVALSAIGSYVTPSYELSIANKLVRVAIVILTAAFGLSGFVISSTGYILMLAKTKSLNTPYMWPFIPFNLKAFQQVFVRYSVPSSESRPSIIHPKRNLK
ncbi:stage V sporulation protein AF [Amphibacillus marinus]|uniref:Stage V sporulation protein AF n=1 Tax=Amphibacillus marinus TaxID=872970 RepID=A0A1H8GBJ7_9BACI|nr:spore germination protein [Amphibacillus marinus]SEN41140.1 stage V sporulation protein AF [Amphibacillus marinus]